MTYQTTSVIIMKLYQRLNVTSFTIRCIHEFPRFFKTEVYVIAATSPFPVSFRRQTFLRFDGTRKFSQTVTCRSRYFLLFPKYNREEDDMIRNF